MLKILILEDDINRIRTFAAKLSPDRFDVVFVTTARGATDHLEALDFDVVFLDHDLGGDVYVDPSNENTGSGVVRWILQNMESVGQPTFVIHSLNTPAAEAMERDLGSPFEHVYRIPFTQLVSNYLDDPTFLG